MSEAMRFQNTKDQCDYMNSFTWEEAAVAMLSSDEGRRNKAMQWMFFCCTQETAAQTVVVLTRLRAHMEQNGLEVRNSRLEGDS